MKQCPRCKEIIGDEFTVCPLCKTEFTEDQLAKMQKAKEEYEVQVLIREKKKIKDFRTKRIIFMGLLIGDLSVYLLGLFIILLPSGSIQININFYFGFSIAFMVIMVGAIAYGLISGGAFCPHCGRIIYRNFGDYCSGCGKKLR